MITRYTSLALFCTLFVGNALAQAPNDDCLSSIPIACGEVVTGSTVDATADNAPACVTGITAPGVWYSFTGDAAQVTVSTCTALSFDTKLNVYTGTCDALICVAGNDDECELGSTATFVAVQGQVYHILVQGYDGQTGAFTLSAVCTALTEDVCEGALPIACGATVSGSTATATEDAAPDCDTGIQAAGVWYTFTGVDAQVQLTTCPNSAYDTRLNVYSGACNELVCVVGNDDTAGAGLCSTVLFEATPGETYYVLVQGYDGETGDFELTMSCATCNTPTTVVIDPSDASASVSWTGAQSGATYTLEYGPAGFAQGTGTVITGTVGIDGPPATINGLQLDTEYDVYIGQDCGNGDVSATAGPIAFTTLAQALAPNAVCAQAIVVSCGQNVQGNTAIGAVATAPTCGPANITTRGLWYRLTGTGEEITFDLCGNATYDSKLSVFSGACGAFVCVAGNDDAPDCPGNNSRVVFPSEAGTDYYVLVHGYGDAQGSFSMAVSCVPGCTPAENDQCASSTVLSIQPAGGCEASTGTNVCSYAPPTPNPECDPFAPINDVWYSFNTGWASTVDLLVAPLTATVVNVALYTDCAEPGYIACWMNVTDPINVGGLPPNTDLLLRVWNGGGSEAGTFTLCVEADITTAINSSTSAPDTRLWPVPAQDLLNVGPLHGVNALQVLDPSGRVVITQGTTQHGTVVLDVHHLAPGLYVVQNEAGRSLGRFVKE